MSEVHSKYYVHGEANGLGDLGLWLGVVMFTLCGGPIDKFGKKNVRVMSALYAQTRFPRSLEPRCLCGPAAEGQAFGLHAWRGRKKAGNAGGIIMVRWIQEIWAFFHKGLCI